MFTRKFWRDAAERALSTAAQAGVLAIGVDVAETSGVDAFSLDWPRVLSFMAGGAALALLKAVAASKLVGSQSSASLDPEA